MKKILVFFIFLLSLTSFAERYFITSKDGYANLREEASIKSKVFYIFIIFNKFCRKILYNFKRWLCKS